MMEMIFFPGGQAELWNRKDNICVGAGKVNAEEGEEGFNAFINFAIALMIYKGDYDPENPIQEGVVYLRD